MVKLFWKAEIVIFQPAQAGSPQEGLCRRTPPWYPSPDNIHNLQNIHHLHVIGSEINHLRMDVAPWTGLDGWMGLDTATALITFQMLDEFCSPSSKLSYISPVSAFPRLPQLRWSSSPQELSSGTKLSFWKKDSLTLMAGWHQPALILKLSVLPWKQLNWSFWAEKHSPLFGDPNLLW